VNQWDLMPLLLLLLFGLSLSAGVAMAFLISSLIRQRRVGLPRMVSESAPESSSHHQRATYLHRPECWAAIKNRNLPAVQSALGMHHPKPCSWIEGLASEEQLFIAPPVHGWVLVIGSGVPDPSQDADACFRFVLALSRKLGHVQVFSASPILHHHAWVRAERGHIVRAYAWAGKTNWVQGRPTHAEKQLSLKCFDYADPTERSSFGPPEGVVANVDKIPLLAARWSLDPAGLDERFLEHARGIAGGSPRRY
jgi:hypothetical protein